MNGGWRLAVATRLLWPDARIVASAPTTTGFVEIRSGLGARVVGVEAAASARVDARGLAEMPDEAHRAVQGRLPRRCGAEATLHVTAPEERTHDDQATHSARRYHAPDCLVLWHWCTPDGTSRRGSKHLPVSDYSC